MEGENSMFRRVLICFMFTLCSLTVAQNDTISFVYALNNQDDNLSQICWLDLSSSEETCLSTDLIGFYSLSPQKRSIAIQDQVNGHIKIVNLENEQIISLQLCQPMQEFLWDEHYHTSGTLLWSPDGRFLSFTGVVSDSGCHIHDSADIYVYDVEMDNLLNLTHDLSVIRSLITPASWSPDSKWLALYGAWSEYENEQGYIVPDWGSAIILRDGSTFFELAPGYNTCRLSWSPNMEWLASNTTCFDAAGTGSSVIVIPFNPTPLTAAGLRIDEVISPLRFDWRADSSWISTYSVPEWIDASTLIVHRQLVPISFGYLSDEQIAEFSVKGLIQIDLDTFSETLLPSTHFDETTYRIDKWFVTQDEKTGSITAFDPHTNRKFTMPASINSCPISYALRIEDQGDFIAVLNACEFPEATPTVDIYEIANFTLIKRITSQDKEMIRPLGFFTSDTK